MRPSLRRTLPALVATALVLPTGVAGATPTVIPNGTFEADESSSSNATTDTELITGWTVMNQLIDLGVTEIAGCPTVDTFDYSQLRDWNDETEPSILFILTDLVTPLQAGEEVAAVQSPYGTHLQLDGRALFHGSGNTDDDWDDDMDGYFIVLDDGSRSYRPDWAPELQSEFDALLVAVTPAPADRRDDVPFDGFYDRLRFSTHLAEMAASDNGEGSILLPIPTLSNEYDGDGFEVDASFLERTGNAVLLFSSISNADDYSADEDGAVVYDGYVARGPAIYSDVFAIEAVPRSITLDWAALGDSDDFAVLGYLLNVDTCAQTEIIDATGESSEWTSTSVTVDTPGDYRFVFVSGTFDKTFGGAAGALFLIDDIAQTAVFSEPGIELELSAEVGATVAGAPVQVSGGGLKATSPYTLTLRSDPVVLVTGTTDDAGRFFDLVDLPDGLTPGVHTLTLVGIAPDDTELTRTTSFTVSAEGTFGSIEGDAAAGSGGSSSVASSDIALSCAPSPALAGGQVACRIAGGPPSASILWRALGTDGAIVATAGVDLDASGSGGFTFTAPRGAAGGTIGVELVAWLPPLQVAVTAGTVPTRVSAGEGTAPLLPLQLGGLLLAAAAGLGAAGRTRRRPTA